MKYRLLGLTLLLAMLFSSGLAERSGMEIPYDRAVEMAHYVHELATGDYLEIKQTPESLKNTARVWAAGISGEPRLMVQVDINNAAELAATRALFKREPPLVGFEAESTAVVEIWQLLAYYASEAAGLSEADYSQIMAVNAQLNASMMYADAGPEGNAMYILLYEDAAPLLYIVCAENGAVSIQAVFLPSEKLARCRNYGEVALWLMLNGAAMTCTEVLPE